MIYNKNNYIIYRQTTAGTRRELLNRAAFSTTVSEIQDGTMKYFG